MAASTLHTIHPWLKVNDTQTSSGTSIRSYSNDNGSDAIFCIVHGYPQSSYMYVHTASFNRSFIALDLTPVLQVAPCRFDSFVYSRDMNIYQSVRCSSISLRMHASIIPRLQLRSYLWPSSSVFKDTCRRDAMRRLMSDSRIIMAKLTQDRSSRTGNHTPPSSSPNSRATA